MSHEEGSLSGNKEHDSFKGSRFLPPFTGQFDVV
jgi:hypothetical protein